MRFLALLGMTGLTPLRRSKVRCEATYYARQWRLRPRSTGMTGLTPLHRSKVRCEAIYYARQWRLGPRGTGMATPYHLLHPVVWLKRAKFAG